MEIMEARKFAERVQEILGDGYEVNAVKVPKNNGDRIGISVKDVLPGQDICSQSVKTVFYPDSTITPEMVADTFTNSTAVSGKQAKRFIECLNDPVKRDNALWVTLSSDPGYAVKYLYKKQGDLYLILSLFLEDEDGSTMKSNITKAHMMLETMKDITKEELFAKAFTNVEQKAKVTWLADEIRKIHFEMQGLESEPAVNLLIGNEHKQNKPDPTSDLVVISIDSHTYGSAGVFTRRVQDWLIKHFNGCCYILPSSVHEVLAVPGNIDLSIVELKEMVQSINQEQVQPEEQLSNEVYCLTSEGLKIA